MSTLRVTKISNRLDDGAIEFTRGAILPVGQAIVDDSGASAIEISTNTGVVTATSFAGSGAGITGLSGAETGKALGLILLI